MSDERHETALSEMKKGLENLEQSRSALIRTIDKLKAMQKGAILVVLLMTAWGGYHLWSSGWIEREFHPQPAADQTIHTMTVQPRPISQELSLSGTLEPFTTVNIPAPFDGPVQALLVNYGQEVTKGQQILVIDDSDFLIKLRNAETEYIKAKQDSDSTKDWRHSSETRDAQRELDRAKNDEAIKKRKLDEAQALYKDGIISRNDLEEAQEAYSTAQDSLAAAKEKFQAELRKGGNENLRIAQIKLENAEATYEGLKARAAKATVVAPVHGVVMKPEASGQNKPMQLAVGASVTQGQPMIAIADLESMEVRAKADEVDVVRLKVGQKVHVTGEAFPGTVLEGIIHDISSQALASSEGSRPTFDVNVTVKAIPPAIAQTIRIGMTAELQVVVYENPKAILVPISAVDAAAKTVQVMDPATRQPKTVTVTTGITTLQDVEIRTGLNPGDVIVTQ